MMLYKKKRYYFSTICLFFTVAIYRSNASSLFSIETAKGNYATNTSSSRSINEEKFISLIEKSDQKSFDLQTDWYTTLFLGYTGAGKSTMINGLLGNVPLIKEEYEKITIKPTDTLHGHFAKIGHGFNPYTLLPEIFLEKSYNLRLCDTPGFSEKTKIEEEICSAIYIKKAIEKSKGIKGLIFVIEIDSLQETRGMLLQNIFSILQRVFRNPINHLSSIFFAFTKVKGQEMKNIYRKLSKLYQCVEKEYQESQDEVAHMISTFLFKMIKEYKDNFFIVDFVTQKGNKVILNNREAILRKCHNTPSIDKKKLLFIGSISSFHSLLSFYKEKSQKVNQFHETKKSQIEAIETYKQDLKHIKKNIDSIQNTDFSSTDCGGEKKEIQDSLEKEREVVEGLRGELKKINKDNSLVYQDILVNATSSNSTLADILGCFREENYIINKKVTYPFISCKLLLKPYMNIKNLKNLSHPEKGSISFSFSSQKTYCKFKVKIKTKKNYFKKEEREKIRQDIAKKGEKIKILEQLSLYKKSKERDFEQKRRELIKTQHMKFKEIEGKLNSKIKELHETEISLNHHKAIFQVLADNYQYSGIPHNINIALFVQSYKQENGAKNVLLISGYLRSAQKKNQDIIIPIKVLDQISDYFGEG